MGKPIDIGEKFDMAPWFRGLSTFQRQASEKLQNGLRDDTEQGTTHRVRSLLQAIGLEPPMSTKILKAVMKMSQNNDVAFLYGAMVVSYKNTTKEKYSLNEQIIMSTIMHLDMIPTLRELDRILPPGHLSKERQERLDRIKKRKDKELRKAMRPKKEHVPAVLPYFEKLVRPVNKRRLLSCKMPDVITTTAPYGRYLDPHYKIPNANRWFASYNLKPSDRIVRGIIEEEIDKIFCNLECAIKWANNTESICEYHFQEFLNERRKKLENTVKMNEGLGIGSKASSYVPNPIAKNKRRQYIKDRLENDIKRNIDRLRKDKDKKLIKVKVISGKSDVCENIIEVGVKDPFIKIFDKQFAPVSPVESYADMPGHYLRPCPCASKKCQKEDKYIAPTCLCQEPDPPTINKYYDELPPCGRRKGGEDKVLPKATTKSSKENGKNLKTPKDSANKSNRTKALKKNKKISSKNLTKKNSFINTCPYEKSFVENLSKKDPNLDVLFTNNNYHKEIYFTKNRKRLVGGVNDIQLRHHPGKFYLQKMQTNEFKPDLDGDESSCTLEDFWNEKKYHLFDDETTTTKKGRKTKTISRKVKRKDSNGERLAGGEIIYKCRPHHKPGSYTISNPCKSACIPKRPPSEDESSTRSREGSLLSASEPSSEHMLLNDECTPSPSVMFFKAATEHTPHSFDYNRIFSFSTESIPELVKKTFIKALDPKHKVPAYWEGHPNVIGAAAYNFQKIFTYGVAKKTKEIHEENKIKKREAAALPTDPEYGPRKIKEAFPGTYFDCEDHALMDRMLEEGMKIMRKNPFYVLASFPDSHKIPILREWIYRRYGKLYSKEERISYMNDAKMTYQELTSRHMKARFPPNSEIKAPINMTYKQRDMLMNKFYDMQQKVMDNMDNIIMKTAREFWFGIHPFVLPRGPPRNTFYAYMPAKIRDIQHFRLWQPSEFRDYKKLRYVTELKKKEEQS